MKMSIKFPILCLISHLRKGKQFSKKKFIRTILVKHYNLDVVNCICLLPVSVVGELDTALDLSSFCGEKRFSSIIIIHKEVFSTFMETLVLLKKRVYDHATLNVPNLA